MNILPKKWKINGENICKLHLFDKNLQESINNTEESYSIIEDGASC